MICLYNLDGAGYRAVPGRAHEGGGLLSDTAQFDRHEDHVHVSWPRKLAYGMGSFSAPLLADASGQLQMFYTMFLRLDPRFVGWGLSIAMVFDAFTDPIMGQISDNTRTRWGRRRPYILFGGLFCSLTFVFLWFMPAGLTGLGAFLYLVAALLLFHAAATITLVPYNALGAELSTDYDERTRVFAWRNGVQLVSSALLLPMWWVAHRQFFGSPRVGFPMYALGLAIIAFLGFGWVFFGTREEAEVQQQERIAFIPAFRATLSNGPFWLVAVAMLLLLVGVLGFRTFSYYVNVYYVFGGDTDKASEVIAVLGGVNFVMEFVGLFAAAKLGLWIGKRNAWMVCLAVYGLAPMASWFLYTPEHPWLQLVLGLLISPCIVGLVMFPWAMLADVVDTDEYRTGRRREGAFYAVFGFIGKAAGAIIVVLIGYVLIWVGFDEKTTAQSAGALLNLRILFAFGPTLIVVLAVPLMVLYPLSEQRVRKLRRVLEARRKRRAQPREAPERR